MPVLWRKAILVLFILGFDAPLFGNQTVDNYLQEMRDHLKKYDESRRGLFSGAPIYHIVPSRSNITLGLSSEYIDTVVLSPDYKAHAKDESAGENKHQLQLLGWNTAPLISFTLKRFGMAFSAEFGQYSTSYLRDQPNYYSYYLQESRIRTSGNGIFLFFVPDFNFLPKSILPVFLVGHRSYNAKHELIGPQSSKQDQAFSTSFQYPVTKYHLGSSINIRPLKKISVSFWYEYTKTNYGELDFLENSLYGSAINEDFILDQYEQTLQFDRELIWQRYPDQNFGLDFAVLFQSFEVHLGGVLGLIGSLAANSPRVLDRGINLSISYSFKAK